jgi:hypothetical protein
MPAIIAIEGNVAADFAAPLTTLTASDTITYLANRRQILVLRNPGGVTQTLNIYGDGGTTINAPGAPNISVAGGYNIAVGAGLSRCIELSKISAYLQGVVTLTGASGMIAQLVNL